MTESEGKVVKKGSRREKPFKRKKLELLIEKLGALTEESFTGYVKINFSQGTIGRVEKFEEILKQPKGKD
jgi:hypothetical protein